MNEYVVLGCLIIGLLISYLMAKKDFRNWKDLEAKEKMYILRPIIGISTLILVVIYKIVNDIC